MRVDSEGYDGLYVREELRKAYRKDLWRNVKVHGASGLARHVDEQPLERCQVSMYAQYHDNIARTVGESSDDVEKARAKYGSGYQVGELSLADPFEKLYYDRYGRGLDGSPMPSKLGGMIPCRRCGLMMGMSAKMMPPNCPRCGFITPLGEFIRDGYYKK